MENLKQILIWLFEALTLTFFVLAIGSLFSFGSSLFRVSDKANQRSHLYVLFAVISMGLLVMVGRPDLTGETIFCFLPFAILTIGFSYFKSKLGRKLFTRFTEKIGIDYPFKDKK